MTLQEVSKHMRFLGDAARVTLADDPSEVPIIPAHRVELEALILAATVIEGMNIMNGIFDGDGNREEVKP